MSRRLVIAASFAALLVLVHPGSASASHVGCFQTVTEDITFDADLICTSGRPGLVIGASGITVDLNGYTLGGGGSIGILNFDGHDEVTIRNGAINGYRRGVQLMNGASRNEVTDLTAEVFQSGFDIPPGVYVENSDDNEIRRITTDSWDAVKTQDSSRNAISSIDCGHPPSSTLGISVIGGADNRVEDSRDCNVTWQAGQRGRIEGNEGAGLSVYQSTGLAIVGNHDVSMRLDQVHDSLVESNDSDGLLVNLLSATGNTIKGNRASSPRLPPTLCAAPETVCGTIILQRSALLGPSSGNTIQGNDLSGGDVGIGIWGSNDNVIEGNAISTAAHSGIRLYAADRNQVSGNAVTDVDRTGIDLEALSDHNLVGDNSVASAGVDGILAENVNVTGNVIAANTVGSSGDDGIDVRIPTTTVTANSAFENADWGIEAVAGTIDGGANRAWSNGRPAQCLNIVCGPGPPASLSLTPESATNTVGDEHCVTATVADPDGSATPGVTVRFSVNGDGTASAETDVGGTATYCYGTLAPGTDEITAFADTDSSGTQDEGEAGGSAAKAWVVPPAERCKATGAGTLTAANGDDAHFSLSAHATPAKLLGRHRYRDFGPAERSIARSRTIESVTCAGRRASVFGTVVVGGAPGAFRFRIDVADGPDTYRIRLSDGYDSGEQPLESGNIRVQ